MKVKSESEVAQSCPTLCDPMDCSLPGSSIHGICQARVLEWDALAKLCVTLVFKEGVLNVTLASAFVQAVCCLRGICSCQACLWTAWSWNTFGGVVEDLSQSDFTLLADFGS